MKKITREEFGMLSWAELWERFNSLQSELEALEGRKGFTPDWSKAPEWANCVSLYWARMHGSDRSFAGEAILFDAIPRPIPPKVTRERTREEKVALIIARLGESGVYWELKDSTIDDLCTVAGISLTEES